MYKVGHYYKTEDAKGVCLDLHRNAAKAFVRYCAVEGVTLHRIGKLQAFVMGDDIAKVAILDDMKALEAWNKSDAYAEYEKSEKVRIAKEVEAEARKKAGV